MKSGIQTPTNGYQVNILDKGMKSTNISYHHSQEEEKKGGVERKSMNKKNLMLTTLGDQDQDQDPYSADKQ